MILSTLSLTFLPYSRFLSLSLCVCVCQVICVCILVYGGGRVMGWKRRKDVLIIKL